MTSEHPSIKVLFARSFEIQPNSQVKSESPGADILQNNSRGAAENIAKGRTGFFKILWLSRHTKKMCQFKKQPGKKDKKTLEQEMVTNSSILRVQSELT